MYLGDGTIKNIFNLLECKRDRKLRKRKETEAKFIVKMKETKLIDIPESEELSPVCKEQKRSVDGDQQ